jgi:hypothetical protein
MQALATLAWIEPVLVELPEPLAAAPREFTGNETATKTHSLALWASCFCSGFVSQNKFDNPFGSIPEVSWF